MTRHAYVLDEHKLVVFWARKAACTSILDSVLFDILDQDKNAFGAGRLRKRWWMQAHGYRRDDRDAVRIIGIRGYRSIAMIREPYERLISVFLSTFVLPNGQPVRGFADLPWFSQDFYCQVTGQTPRRKGFGCGGLSFFDFVTAVCDRIDRHWIHGLRDRYIVARSSGLRTALLPPRTAEPWLNPHWNTQIPRSFLSNGFEYDHLFSTGQSGTFFEKLSELTGREIEEKRLNRSNYAPSAGSGGERNLVHDNPLQYAEDPTAIDKALFESAELRDRVRRSFVADYHHFQKSVR